MSGIQFSHKFVLLKLVSVCVHICIKFLKSIFMHFVSNIVRVGGACH